MKKLVFSIAVLSLLACSGKTETNTSTTTATTESTASTAADSKWDDVSTWKKLDLNSHNMPFSISVPAGATAKKDDINTEAVVVDLKSEPMCAYTMQKETLGGDPIKTVAEAVKMHKETYNGFTDFKVLKEDANGYTYSYKDMAGQPAHGFYFAKEAGGAVYGINTLNDFTGTAEQVDKMYNGLK